MALHVSNSSDLKELCASGYVDPASYFSQVMGVNTCSRPLDVESACRKRKWECDGSTSPNDSACSAVSAEPTLPAASDEESVQCVKKARLERTSSTSDGSETDRPDDGSHYTAQCLLREYQKQHSTGAHRFRHKKKMEAQLLEEIATSKTEESERLAQRITFLESEVQKLRQQVFLMAFVKTLHYYLTMAGQTASQSENTVDDASQHQEEPPAHACN
eukprot:comp17037_c0_seq1/m.15742 comp17037_c0_seq1/g.15742  ORF comp17037_c0_seq1/g.15742 comp17037_c0_seq1/m.15742 type:complete len:217 (-) comp17037_c0_seq1:395-1045(-)